MKAFAPHKAILALRETPDATLHELIRSHRVTEDSHLSNDDASGLVTAWHVEFGLLLRNEQRARAGGDPPDDIQRLVKPASNMSNAELASVLAYLLEYRNHQTGPLQRFAQSLGMEISASILDYGQANQSQITYN